MRDLKLAYRQTYWNLRRALKEAQSVTRDEDGNIVQHPDVKVLKGAISDVNFTIQYLHTGRRPGNKRGIERRAAYQREVLMDPIKMQAYISQSHAGSPANLSDYEQMQIEDALSLLSKQEKICYEMKHGQCLSLEYIGNYLGISKGVVDNYVRRAQKKISEQVNCKLVLECVGG